ncbi:hypothetical protein BDC45DRAFT_558989 [Circinella umbellata]|nr:hypothetical protein BDC45DRAFT_558989 [Circinella umbellata]
MFSKRSRTGNITRGLAMAVCAVSLQFKTREKKIAPLRKKNRTGSTTHKEQTRRSNAWQSLGSLKLNIKKGSQETTLLTPSKFQLYSSRYWVTSSLYMVTKFFAFETINFRNRANFFVFVIKIFINQSEKYMIIDNWFRHRRTRILEFNFRAQKDITSCLFYRTLDNTPKTADTNFKAPWVHGFWEIPYGYSNLYVVVKIFMSL